MKEIWQRIKETLPGVVREYPYSASALVIIGFLAGAILF